MFKIFTQILSLFLDNIKLKGNTLRLKKSLRTVSFIDFKHPILKVENHQLVNFYF